MSVLAAIAAGGAAFLFFAYLIRTRVFRPAEDRLRYLSADRTLNSVRTEHEEDGRTLLRRESSSLPTLRRFLSTSGYAEQWAFDLERAGLTLRPGEYFLIRLLIAALVFIVAFMIGQSALALVIGVLAGGLAFMLPAFWLQRRIQGRLHKIDAQLVETLTLIANALRSGFAFAQGIDVASKRIPPPMAMELGRLLLDINLGSTIEDALRGLNRRVGSDDVDMVVTAILIQRASGGNLAEILESVTATIRERERIRGEIKTMTAQQRLTGWVLSVWPALLGLVFFLINPHVMSLLWTTTAGIVMLVVWVILNTLGIFTIQRILNIDI